MRGSLMELENVTPHNIKQLKRLNQIIFPVHYNDKFYRMCLCQQNLKVPSGQIADTQQRPMNKLQMNFLVLVVTK
uniref:Uncharacterized protein n=1 Tax=Castor canadensis TaxID=51338 RepID=A0A8C1A079_CASCN